MKGCWGGQDGRAAGMTQVSGEAAHGSGFSAVMCALTQGQA